MEQKNINVGVEAASYYLKSTQNLGKLFHPKTYTEVLDKMMTKYHLFFDKSDFYDTLLKEKNGDNKIIAEVFKYVNSYNFKSGITIARALRKNALIELEKEFVESFNYSQCLASYVERCVIEGIYPKVGAKIAAQVDELEKDDDKGYKFSWKMNLLNSLINSKNKIEVERKVNRYMDESQLSSSRLINSLAKIDLNETNRILNEILKSNDDINEMMCLLTDVDLVNTLLDNTTSVVNRDLKEALELELDRKLFAGMYRCCFESNKLKNSRNYSKDLALKAIEYNIPFLCTNYYKSYNKQLNKDRNREAMVSLATLIKENRDIANLKSIYFWLGKNEEEINSFECAMYELGVNDFLFFARGKNCESLIEQALLKNARDFYSAVVLSASDPLLKLNYKAIENVTSKLIKFPSKEMNMDIENTKNIEAIYYSLVKEKELDIMKKK